MVWARLQADLNCNLRRGAWYKLIKADGLAALVDVKGTPVAVVRAFLQMSNTPPRKWTVVPRPQNVPRSIQIGERYAVAVVRTESRCAGGRRCWVGLSVSSPVDDEHYLA